MLRRVQSAALIVNPFSTRVTKRNLEQVEQALAQYAEVETLPTGWPDHATTLARDAANNHDALLVFSGDGVFNEVVNGIERKIPLGFIPGGRTNVLPRALGLPRDPVAAARHIGEALAAARTRTISLGRVNGRRFTFAAGIGADAEFIRRIDERRRSHDGRLPGDVTAAWVLAQQFLWDRRRYGPAMQIEGIGRAASAFVVNGDVSTYVGRRAVRFAPDARFDLGLDIAAPRVLHAGSLPRIAWRSLRGRRLPDVLYGHDLDRITIFCDRPLPLQVDGEDLGDVREAHFEVERDAAKVLT